MKEKKISWTHFQLENEDDIHDDEPYQDTIPLPILELHPPIANTIIGPIDPNSDFMEIFDNIWIMDTNFRLTKENILQISDIEGVELVKPVSQYKCIIGFGKLFESRDVKLAIENLLTGKHIEYLQLCQLDESVRNKAINVYNKINKYPYWILYILPNGSIEEFYSTNKDEFENKIQEITEYAKLSNGLLLKAGQ